ncbi:hypothetical protein EYF80_060437 [Liparis tanakae]|uniref:Uncharacterized protein n=1 Tax=Liparis tanakae TaxID=230148 RepID=A0A4Z2EKZ0_9TELE|nr:hypothetical protein EYF80_060437 [Liparis tanakae]
MRWACRFLSLRYQMPQSLHGKMSSERRQNTQRERDESDGQKHDLDPADTPGTGTGRDERLNEARDVAASSPAVAKMAAMPACCGRSWISDSSAGEYTDSSFAAGAF